MKNTTPRSATPFLPATHTLAALRTAAARCQGCELYRRATQTVFGEGDPGARAVFIGEQPGDLEDRLGHPFVGPAGRLLDRALAATGLAREQVYVTNAVKHFKWEPRGKRRLHKRPDDGEIRACHPWLHEEIALIRPAVVVCLGVTAAHAAFGRAVRLKDYRGHFIATPLAEATFVTLHPSAILRLPPNADREVAFDEFAADLARVAARLEPAKNKGP